MANKRPEIIAKAYEMMGDTGLESVHHRTVAAALGINHATVHYYFRQRSDLLVGIAEEALERLKGDRETFYADAARDSDRLNLDMELAGDYSSKGSRFFRVVQGLFVASLSTPELRKHAQAIYEEWRKGIAGNASVAKIKKRSPYMDGDLLAATLLGIGLSSQLFDGKGGPSLMKAVQDSIDGTASA